MSVCYLGSTFSFDFEAIQVQDVLQSLNSIDPKKAPGPDGLDPFLLKVAAPVIAKPITHIFNMSLSSNQTNGSKHILHPFSKLAIDTT